MHFAPGPADEFEPWETHLIEREVAAFERGVRLRWSEREDLVAEAQIAWWRQRRLYVPGRGASRQSFLKLVVRHALADISKAERAPSRAAAVDARSLDAPVDTSDARGDSGLRLQDVIGDERDAFSEVDFELDIEPILRRLTGRQQQLIRGRLQGEEVKTLSARLGVHRDTLYEDLKQIRAMFRAEGLLDADPTVRPSRSQRESGGPS